MIPVLPAIWGAYAIGRAMKKRSGPHGAVAEAMGGGAFGRSVANATRDVLEWTGGAIVSLLPFLGPLADRLFDWAHQNERYVWALAGIALGGPMGAYVGYRAGMAVEQGQPPVRVAAAALRGWSEQLAVGALILSGVGSVALAATVGGAATSGALIARKMESGEEVTAEDAAQLGATMEAMSTDPEIQRASAIGWEEMGLSENPTPAELAEAVARYEDLTGDQWQNLPGADAAGAPSHGTRSRGAPHPTGGDHNNHAPPTQQGGYVFGGGGGAAPPAPRRRETRGAYRF